MASLRRNIEGWLLLCDRIPGFREYLKEAGKQTSDLRRICVTVSILPHRVTHNSF